MALDRSIKDLEKEHKAEIKRFSTTPIEGAMELLTTPLPNVLLLELIFDYITNHEDFEPTDWLEAFYQRLHSPLMQAFCLATSNNLWILQRTAAWLELRLKHNEPVTEELGRFLCNIPSYILSPEHQKRLIAQVIPDLTPYLEKESLSNSSTDQRSLLRNLMADLDIGIVSLPAIDPELAQTIRELQTLWESTRSPQVATLLKQLSAQLPAPPNFSRIAERERWCALVLSRKDPALVGLVLQLPWPARWSDGTDRLARMKECPPDPRISEALLSLLQQNTQPYWNSIYLLAAHSLEVLVRMGDPMTAEAASKVEPVSGTRIEINGKSLTWKKAIKSHPKPQKLTEAQQQILAQSQSLLKTNHKTQESLLAEIFSAPHDISLRRVLADLLVEAGDPRGEFIQIQCDALEGRVTPEGQKREAVLLKKYRDRWAKEFPQPDKVEFVGGFVARSLVPMFQTNQIKMLDNPFWKLVKTIRFYGWLEPDLLGKVLDHPNMVGVTELETPIALEESLVSRLQRMTTLALFMDRRINLKQFPNLTRLLAQSTGFHWPALKGTAITELSIYWKANIPEKMPNYARNLKKLTLVCSGELHAPSGVYFELMGPGLKTFRVCYSPAGGLGSVEATMNELKLDPKYIDKVELDIPASAHLARKIIETWKQTLPPTLHD